MKHSIMYKYLLLVILLLMIILPINIASATISVDNTTNHFNITTSTYYVSFNKTWGGIDTYTNESQIHIYVNNYTSGGSTRPRIFQLYDSVTGFLICIPNDGCVSPTITIKQNTSTLFSINVSNGTGYLLYNFTENNIKVKAFNSNNYRIYAYFNRTETNIIYNMTSIISVVGAAFIDSDSPYGKLIFYNNVNPTTGPAFILQWNKSVITDYDYSRSSGTLIGYLGVAIGRGTEIAANTPLDIIIQGIPERTIMTNNLMLLNQSWLRENQSFSDYYPFNSSFEGGNGNETLAKQIDDNEFIFNIEKDNGTVTADNTNLWFYTTIVSNKTSLMTVNVTKIEQNTTTSIYPIISTDNINWVHIPIENQTGGGSGNSFWEKFNFSTVEGTKYYIAMHRPYVTGDLTAFNNTILNNPYVRITTVATSEQGRPIIMYNISNTASSSSGNNKFMFIGGQHAALESTGALSIEGMINWLLNSSAINYGTFYFIPMSNPDGVVAGNSRNNMNATEPRELNRNWYTPNQSETIGITSFIDSQKPFIYMGDIHSWQGTQVYYRYISTTANETPYLNILSQFENFIPYDKLQNNTLDTANTFHVEMQNNSIYTNISTTTEFKFNYNWNRDDWANDSDQRQQGEYYIRAILNGLNIPSSTTSIITVPANSWTMFNNWTNNESFIQISANESNDVAYSFYNVSTGEWDSYFLGYSWNANNIIDKNNSVMGYFDAPTTITARTIIPATMSLTTGWNMIYIEGVPNKTISNIKANIGANIDEVYRYNSTTNAYSNTVTESLQANEGFLAYANTNFTWIRSTI